MSVKKRIIQIAVFLLVMFLTFYALFSGRDLAEIGHAVLKMSPLYLTSCVALALFYVCAEGFMIWYLLNAMREKKKQSVPVLSVFFYRFLLFGNYTFCHRGTAGSALLYEQRRKPSI